MTVRWWEKDNVAFANLVVGLAQINRRADRDPVDELYRRLAYALMQFANGYSDARDFGPMGEARKVRTYLRDCAAWAFDDDFLDGEALRRLAAFRPMIASDDAVRETREQVRRLELTDDELVEARESQQALVSAVEQYDRLRCQQHRQEIGWCLGDLLYVVRCNLDHSEKTPFGPDVTKAKRDFAVLSVALPVLEHVLLRTLDQPQYRFATYGTLRWGELNHVKIADLGEPATGKVNGKVAHAFGYPVFTWSVDGDEVPVELYSSKLLTVERWKELDGFEGSGYRRILVPVRLPHGERLVSTIYAAAAS